MSFLSPWGLLGLLSLPALVWLWRWSSMRHRTVISSLIPFEHLLRRSPTRTTRPILNWLFWLQAAALALAAVSLARPALPQASSRTVLIVLDTSASMGARLGNGPSAFARAREALARRLAARRWRERFFIVTTSPVAPLMPEPLGDTARLRQALGRVEPSALEGNLTMAARVGISLLGGAPDEMLVLTDEPSPDPAANDGAGAATLRSFGAPLPNVAIVGIETQASLCTVGKPNVVVTVQNFSDREQRVDITARRRARVVASQTHTLAASERLPARLALPEPSDEPIEIDIAAEQDALDVDDHALVQFSAASALPVLVASSRPDVMQALGRWLDACARLRWTAVAADEGAAARLAEALQRDPTTILVTDEPALLQQWAGPAVVFAAAASPGPRTASWIVDHTHPIGEYLQPLETISIMVSSQAAASGEPVIWSLVEGQRVAVVRADASHGRRVVSMQFDPLTTAVDARPVIILLNSLRWLSASLGFVTTGEPLTVGPMGPGLVRVRRPRGPAAAVLHDGGMLSYDATDAPGRYVVSGPGASVERLVNFVNPVESNLMARASTWFPDAVRSASLPRPTSDQGREPVAAVCLLLALLIWIAEWLAYVWKRRKAGVR